MSDIENEGPLMNDNEDESDIEDEVVNISDNNDSGDEEEVQSESDNENDSDLEELEEENYDTNTHIDTDTDNSKIQMIDFTGGAPDDDINEINEDILGETNKKLLYQDDITILHPESRYHNYDEIYAASIVTRNSENIIIDSLHKTIPILTKYEKAKILGQRTKQLNSGNKPFVAVDRKTLDNSIIAEQELLEKKLPFIIQRPIPGGGVEYWNVKDLELI